MVATKKAVSDWRRVRGVEKGVLVKIIVRKVYEMQDVMSSQGKKSL